MDDEAFVSPMSEGIAETALGVLDASKNSNQALLNVSSLYQEGDDPLSYEGRNEVLEHEPAYTVKTAEEFEDDNNRKNHDIQILTALNGLPASNADQVEAIVAFAGFVRSETANEHMKDNANGSLALKVHGVFSTLHTGITDIRGGGLVRIRAPTPEEAKLQKIVGRRQNKILLMTEEYRPELDAVDKKNAFVALMMQTGVSFEPREREIVAYQAKIYQDWWKAKRTQFAVFAAELAALDARKNNDNERTIIKKATDAYTSAAANLGLLTGTVGDIEFQRSLLKRLFTMNSFSGIAQEDVLQAYYPSPRSASSSSNLSPSEQSTRAELFLLQTSAIQNEQNAIISGHAKNMNSIIGKAPKGAKKGCGFDLVMYKLGL